MTVVDPRRAARARAAVRAAAVMALLVLTAACSGVTAMSEVEEGFAVDDAPGVAGTVAQPGEVGGDAGAEGEPATDEQPAEVSGQQAATTTSGASGATARPAPNPLSARTSGGGQTAAPEAADDPLGVEIPSIGVRSYLVRLGLDGNRSMEVPDDFSLAGWYVHGPKPGQVGPAVIAGHVDGRRGPAVFNRLDELNPGDPVHVHRADGQVVTFVVDRVEQHPKAAFPTEQVYGNTSAPELRLITCGGTYDRRARSHRDNVIVFATLA